LQAWMRIASSITHAVCNSFGQSLRRDFKSLIAH
jgi:hypothetical protein